MPSESRRERLMAYLEGRFGTITKAGGYWYDVAIVERGHPTPQQMDGAKSPHISLAPGPLSTDPERRRHGKDVAIFDIDVRGSIKITSSMNGKEQEQTIDRLTKDIIKAFFSGDLGFGCDAITSWIAGLTTTPDTGFPGWLTCELTFTVEYMLNWADP